MYLFHFNGGSGRDYVVIAESFNKALNGLRDLGINNPEKLDCFSSAPLHMSETVTIRATNLQSFYMHTSRAKE